MFFLFIFSLVSLCDPLPSISGGLVTTALSQVAPLLAKNSRNSYDQYDKPVITSMPMLYQKGINNGTHQSFRRSATSSNNQSPPVKTDKSQKNHYLLPAEPPTRTQVYSRDNQANGLEPKSSTDASYGQVTIQNSYTSMSTENEMTTQGLETDFPLLKLNRDYTPNEIAEYIFVTEDEKGFVQGVAEMITDGQIMASTDDVILYLEAVQEKLDKLRKFQQNTSVPKTTTQV